MVFLSAGARRQIDLTSYHRRNSCRLAENSPSISGYSDVDYFASLSEDVLLDDSTATLRLTRNALDTRFPTSGVRVNCPAVEVPFGLHVSETT